MSFTGNPGSGKTTVARRMADVLHRLNGHVLPQQSGMSSRIAHHIDFPNYSEREWFQIAEMMAAGMHYRFDADGVGALLEYIALRMQQPRFSNARSIPNGIDRARLRMANRLFADRDRLLSRNDLETITAEDIRASRVFLQ